MFKIEFPLTNIFDKFGGFHEKATVLAYSNGDHILESYGERICLIDEAQNVYMGKHFMNTATSMRHLKEFLKQHGIMNITKLSDIQKLPVKDLYYNV